MSINPGQYSIKCVGFITQVLGVDGSNNFADGYREREIPRHYWQISSSGEGLYTIQNASTNRYLSYSGGRVSLEDGQQE